MVYRNLCFFYFLISLIRHHKRRHITGLQSFQSTVSLIRINFYSFLSLYMNRPGYQGFVFASLQTDKFFHPKIFQRFQLTDCSYVVEQKLFHNHTVHYDCEIIHIPRKMLEFLVNTLHNTASTFRFLFYFHFCFKFLSSYHYTVSPLL